MGNREYHPVQDRTETEAEEAGSDNRMVLDENIVGSGLP